MYATFFETFLDKPVTYSCKIGATTLSIMTLSIMGLFAKLSIKLHCCIVCHYAHIAQCQVSFIVVLNVVMKCRYAECRGAVKLYEISPCSSLWSRYGQLGFR
jgi:hypothetical protein